MRLGGALLLVAAVPLTAAADGVAPAKDPDPNASSPSSPSPGPAPSAPSSGYSHQGMFEASLRIGVGLRSIIPYEKTDYCGESDSSTSTGNAPVCSGRAPFAFDIELGYGLTRRIDLLAEVRLGVESDFPSTGLTQKSGPHPFHLSPGARFFFADAKSTKLFTTAQIVLDFTGYEDSAGNSRGTDFGIRNLSGIWLDLEQGYGFYAYIGETATFSRWWMFELEAGIGVQARYR